MGSLPARVRPAICAFGGLADGFLPFDIGGGRTEQLRLASVVMKAVQARLCRQPSVAPSCSVCSASSSWGCGMCKSMCLSCRPPGLHWGLDMLQCESFRV